MVSQYSEVDEQDRQRLNEALVELLLTDWMMTSDVCLSPLLGFDEMDAHDQETGTDEEDGGMK